jgi:hypothetical protein
LSSLARSTHAPAQAVVPPLQFTVVHVPLVQASFIAQRLPHAPQFMRSVDGSTHAVPHMMPPVQPVEGTSVAGPASVGAGVSPVKTTSLGCGMSLPTGTSVPIIASVVARSAVLGASALPSRGFALWLHAAINETRQAVPHRVQRKFIEVLRASERSRRGYQQSLE